MALVGSSGAGRSTIASLVPRLYDVDTGAVRLSGVDVADLSFDDLRGAVGMVTQDGHLFHDRAGWSSAAPTTKLLARDGRYAHLYRTQFAGQPLSVH